MFSTLPKALFSFWVTFILYSANAFNLDWSKILLFGKELYNFLFLRNSPFMIIRFMSFRWYSRLLLVLSCDSRWYSRLLLALSCDSRWYSRVLLALSCDSRWCSRLLLVLSCDSRWYSRLLLVLSCDSKNHRTTLEEGGCTTVSS